MKKSFLYAALALAVGVSVAFGLFGVPGPRAEVVVAAPGSPPMEYENIAEAFLGEELSYRIGFWFIDEMAVGSITLEEGKDPGVYLATFEAQTTGIVGWFLKYRKDKYISTMTLSEDGRSFVTRTFDKVVDKGGKVRRGKRILDYEKGVMTWRSWGGGSPEKTGELPLPEGRRVDGPLAAFYNFRSGVYGPIEGGRELTIVTFPKEENPEPEIYVRIATPEELEKRVSEKKTYAEHLIDARIDKELFGQQKGEVEILFSPEMVPVEAVARDVILFGDIKGKLASVGVGMDLTKTAD